ncbi:MAG: helix-turn-helix transcriptional regulator [Bacilli bacterium]|nr:helix-turn-helix transcriptional regulator [Bacilli bacterium]
MDFLFLLFNSMAIFFGIASLILTLFINAKSGNKLLRNYAILQSAMLLRQVFYVLKSDNPLLHFPSRLIEIFYSIDFLLLIVSMLYMAIIISFFVEINFFKYIFPPLAISILLFGYGSLSFLFSFIPSVFSFLPDYVWIIAGYGVMQYYWSLLVFHSYKIKNRKKSVLYRLTGFLGLALTLVLIIDDLYLFPGVQSYGFFSFPVFHIILYCTSLLVLANSFLIANRKKETIIDAILHTDYGLSRREIEIAHRIVDGALYKEIAVDLHISIGTVKTHVNNIYKKTGSTNKIDLVKVMRNH